MIMASADLQLIVTEYFLLFGEVKWQFYGSTKSSKELEMLRRVFEGYFYHTQSYPGLLSENLLYSTSVYVDVFQHWNQPI